MAAYMAEYKVGHDSFAPFALLAHANAARAPHAVFHNKPLDLATYQNAKTLTAPVTVRGKGEGEGRGGGGGWGVQGRRADSPLTNATRPTAIGRVAHVRWRGGRYLDVAAPARAARGDFGFGGSVWFVGSRTLRRSV
jgi:hypothetical protein